MVMEDERRRRRRRRRSRFSRRRYTLSPNVGLGVLRGLLLCGVCAWMVPSGHAVPLPVDCGALVGAAEPGVSLPRLTMTDVFAQFLLKADMPPPRRVLLVESSGAGLGNNVDLIMAGMVVSVLSCRRLEINFPLYEHFFDLPKGVYKATHGGNKVVKKDWSKRIMSSEPVIAVSETHLHWTFKLLTETTDPEGLALFDFYERDNMIPWFEHLFSRPKPHFYDAVQKYETTAIGVPDTFLAPQEEERELHASHSISIAPEALERTKDDPNAHLTPADVVVPWQQAARVRREQRRRRVVAVHLRLYIDATPVFLEWLHDDKLFQGVVGCFEQQVLPAFSQDSNSDRPLILFFTDDPLYYDSRAASTLHKYGDVWQSDAQQNPNAPRCSDVPCRQNYFRRIHSGRNHGNSITSASMLRTMSEWFVMAEADIIVSSGSSFSKTAQLRSGCPIFQPVSRMFTTGKYVDEQKFDLTGMCAKPSDVGNPPPVNPHVQTALKLRPLFHSYYPPGWQVTKLPAFQSAEQGRLRRRRHRHRRSLRITTEQE